MSDIGVLALAAQQGDVQARTALFESLYRELHRMARRELWKAGDGVTLSATTLLHEAYLGLVRAQAASFPDKARFMGYVARAMRTLIIDHVRARQAQKRGGQFEFTALDTEAGAPSPQADHLQAVSDALEDLARLEPGLAEVVDLKFFCGLTFREIGAMRQVSERTVQRDWEKARLLLHRALGNDALA
jgi:RNA polymerase sigma factor (TIGR02999 family)